MRVGFCLPCRLPDESGVVSKNTPYFNFNCENTQNLYLAGLFSDDGIPWPLHKAGTKTLCWASSRRFPKGMSGDYEEIVKKPELRWRGAPYGW